jgi:hypothetical protein
VRFLLAWSLLCGCQGDGAAVGVRWMIADLSSGSIIKPDDRSIALTNGGCGAEEPDAAPLPSWRIDRVRLVIAEPVSGIPVLPADDPRLLFNCNQREAITPFSLPTGTFALSLRAVNLQGVDDFSVVTPAPSVRALKSAEVVNLDVVELGIHPVTLAPSDGGADMAIPDLAPPI